MSSIINKTLDLIRLKKRTARLPFDSALKQDIFTAARKVKIFKPKDRGWGELRLGSFTIHYCHFGNLEYVFDELFLQAEYLFNPSNPKPIIIDAGANIGLATLFFKLLWPDAAVTAFEPDADAFQCLQKNVTDNQLTQVTPVQAALAKNAGQLKFYVDGSDTGSLTSSTQQQSGGVEVAVDGVRLSDYINEPIDLLKMDIEGGEFEVMEDLVASGKLPYVQQLFMEYHHHLAGAHDRLANMLATLEQFEFSYLMRGDFDNPPQVEQQQNLIIYARNNKPLTS